jgi:penicillin-insensitive murein endopeptidase
VTTWGVLALTLTSGVALGAPPSTPLAVRIPVQSAESNEEREAGFQGPSRSIGTPWRGSLERGVLLREGATVRYLPRYAGSGHFWGIDALVRALRRGAAAVASRWPGSRLPVGELSRRNGGFMRRHQSHRSGRDADIGFYTRDEGGRFGRLAAFMGFGRRAPLSPGAAVRFDDARNWTLVHALMTDPEVRVQYLFAARPIRARLLSHARRRGVDDALLRRVAAVMVEPRFAESHDDHFHLRVYCPSSQRDECRDADPYWPWYEGEPPGGAYSQLPTIRWRPVAAPAATTKVTGVRAPRAANPRRTR